MNNWRLAAHFWAEFKLGHRDQSLHQLTEPLQLNYQTERSNFQALSFLCVLPFASLAPPSVQLQAGRSLVKPDFVTQEEHPVCVWGWSLRSTFKLKTCLNVHLFPAELSWKAVDWLWAFQWIRHDCSWAASFLTESFSAPRMLPSQHFTSLCLISLFTVCPPSAHSIFD